HTLEKDFSHLSGSDKDKFDALLHKKDGDIASQHGDRIKAALSEMHELTGASKKACEENIRTTLASMNEQQIKDMDAYYQKTYGTSLRDAVMKDDKISQATKDACDIYLKGNNNRTDEDTLKLADIAVKERDVNRFKEAMAGASDSAREKFEKNDG